MRTQLLLALTWLAVGCARPAAPVPDYTAPGGDFRIALPKEPAVEVQGPATSYKVADGNMTFIVRRFPCPPEFAGDATPDRLFDKFQEASVQSLQGTLENHRPVVSGPHPGREFVVHAVTKRTGEPYEMTNRIFRVGPDVYMLHATTPRDERSRARALSVLDSFAILK